MPGSGGSGPGQKRMKDAAMAARLKQDDVKRTAMRCPACTGIVSIATFYGHISTLCKGGKREDYV